MTGLINPGEIDITHTGRSTGRCMDADQLRDQEMAALPVQTPTQKAYISDIVRHHRALLPSRIGFSIRISVAAQTGWKPVSVAVRTSHILVTACFGFYLFAQF